MVVLIHYSSMVCTTEYIKLIMSDEVINEFNLKLEFVLYFMLKTITMTY